MFENKETGQRGYLRANMEICPQIEDESGQVIEVYDTITEMLEQWKEVEPKRGAEDATLEKMRQLEGRVTDLEKSLDRITNIVIGREARKNED